MQCTRHLVVYFYSMYVFVLGCDHQHEGLQRCQIKVSSSIQVHSIGYCIFTVWLFWSKDDFWIISPSVVIWYHHMSHPILLAVRIKNGSNDVIGYVDDLKIFALFFSAHFLLFFIIMFKTVHDLVNQFLSPLYLCFNLPFTHG